MTIKTLTVSGLNVAAQVLGGTGLTSSTTNGVTTLNVSGTQASGTIFSNPTAASYAELYVDSNDRRVTLGQRSSTNAGGDLAYLYTATATPMSFWTSAAERMRITAAGNVVIGSGDGTGTIAGNTLRGPSAAGTNIAGGSLTVAGGAGTGTGSGGNITFQTALTGITGSSSNAFIDRMSITPNIFYVQKQKLSGIGATVSWTTVTTGAISSVLSVGTAGSGYSVGDRVYVNSGNYDAAIAVSAVSSGQVTAWSLVSGGTGYTANGTGISTVGYNRSAHVFGFATAETILYPGYDKQGNTAVEIAAYGNGSSGSSGGDLGFPNLVFSSNALGPGSVQTSPYLGMITWAARNTSFADKRAALFAAELEANSTTTTFGRFVWATSSGAGIEDRMRLTSGGTLTIGTMSPSTSSRFVTSTSTGSGATATWTTFSGGAITGTVSAPVAGSGYAAGDQVRVSGTGNGDAILRVATLTGSGVATWTLISGGTGYTAAGTGVATGFLYAASFLGGNVGIGTTVPTAPLSVSSSAADVYIDRPVNTADGSLILRGGPTTATSGMFVARGSGGTYNVGGVEIYTNGSERMRITSAGNVGIGTGSPSAYGVLTVNGDLMVIAAGNSGYLRLSGNANQGTINANSYWTGSNNAAAIAGYSPSIDLRIDDGGIRFWTSTSVAANATLVATEKMRITSAGNVGVGTTSPGAKLHVIGSSGRSSSTSLSWNTNTTAIFDNNNEVFISLYSASNSNAGILFQETGSGGGASGQIIYSAANSSMRFVTAQSERMRIDSSGNVGIGTTAPAQKLHVASDGYNFRISNAGNTLGYNIGRSVVDGLLYFYGDQTGYNGYVFTGVNGERMRITSAGNVGIGTASPGQLLDINSITGTNRLIQFSQSGTAKVYVGIGMDNVMRVQTTDSAQVRFGTNGADRLSIDSAGNVGIGTTSPGSPLDIQGATGFFVNLRRANGATSEGPDIRYQKSRGSIATPAATISGDYLGTITFDGYDGASFVRGAGIYATINGTVATNSVPTDLQFLTLSGTTLAERMRITSAGKVGVGTATPSAYGALTVAGDVFVGPVGSGGYGRLAYNTTLVSLQSNVYWNGTSNLSSVAGYSSLLDLRLDDGSIRFSTSTSVAANTALVMTERMIINASGNVGIGTTSPGEKLEVNTGNIFSNGEGYGLIVDSIGSKRIGFMKYGGIEGALVHGNATPLRFGRVNQASVTGGSFTTEMIIDTSGNVGIGTSSPSEKLTILDGNFRIDKTSYGGRLHWTQGTASPKAGVWEWGDGTGWRMDFGPPATPRFSIMDNGNVGIGTGTTNPTYGVDVIATANLAARFRGAAGNHTVVAIDSASDILAPYLQFRRNGVDKWLLQAWTDNNFYVLDKDFNHGVYISQDTTSWVSNSDARLKDVIGPIENATAKVNALSGVRYTWKRDADKSLAKVRVGLIAQDVFEVLPESVEADNPDIITDEETGKVSGGLGVRYTELVPLLVNAIKELTARVKTLEERGGK